ncbi:MAG: hypothetical protein ACW98U_16660 [Candidatus Thorarchaeota archaeon]|jgi:energy-coupling factor transport system substrate-specific component
MSETETTEAQDSQGKTVKENLYLQDSNTAVWTLLAILIGAGIYLVFNVIPIPYLSYGFFTLGLAPAFAVVATLGAIRGPVAGFLTGYVGELIFNIFLTGNIVTFSLYGVAIGTLGLVSGIPSYDFDSGRSLAKLSILSAIGLIFSALLTTVIGLFVEQIAILVAIGLQLLPLLTIGLPTVILLTPLFARLWSVVSVRSPWP